MSVMSFMKLLIKVCPFPIVEIQTDNDTAFTDKFSSGIGVTGEHKLDQWCCENQIRHKLIPVGVKELNGKVENTHKQDDREFYSKGPYKDFKNIRINIKGYNERWNQIRRTKTLGWKSPDEVIAEAYVRSLAWLMWMKPTTSRLREFLQP
jgi:transposase InsO family protein